MFFNPGFIRIVQRVQHVAFQLGGAAHHVFTGNNIQRGANTLRFTLDQPFGDGRRNALQHDRTNRGGHEINLGNQFNDIVADAADGVNAGNGINLLIFTDNMNLIAMTGIQGVENHLIYIRKRQLYPRVCQQFADKATTDITCAKM
ncbi:hypothetical protein D3C73_1029460 [compost metagenome]